MIIEWIVFPLMLRIFNIVKCMGLVVFVLIVVQDLKFQSDRVKPVVTLRVGFTEPKSYHCMALSWPCHLTWSMWPWLWQIPTTNRRADVEVNMIIWCVLMTGWWQLFIFQKHILKHFNFLWHIHIETMNSSQNYTFEFSSQNYILEFSHKIIS